MTLAAQALSQDEFSKCFEPKPVAHHPGVSLRYLFYVVGVFIRYFILFPFRLTVLLMGTMVVGFLLPLTVMSQNEELNKLLFMYACKTLLFCFSAWIRHHGEKPQPGMPHIFVSNHTSFTDFFLTSSHRFPHAAVAQVHGGLFGLMQRHVLGLNGSLFFYRDEGKDKEKLAKKMRAHVMEGEWRRNSPLIIFPEGTCVNNEYTVLFHKGAFELGCAVCPVAIKYNKRLLDPYWNTREQSFTQHILYLMTRWCMIADVWWLPPQRKGPAETSIDFANRVKAIISEAAGLKNLSWDGYMKNFVRQHDHEKLRTRSQAKYVHSLRLKLPTLIGPDDGILEDTLSAGGSDGSKKAFKRLSIGAGLVNQGNVNNVNHQSPDINRGDGFLEGLEPSRIVELKNEILAASPVAIVGGSAFSKGEDTFSASATTTGIRNKRKSTPSAFSVGGESFIEHLSLKKDKVISSWKRFSQISSLDTHHFAGEANDKDQEEARLDYTGWRLWNLHQKEYRERQRRRSSIPADNLADPLEESISTGINLDDDHIEDVSDDEEEEHSHTN